MDNGVDLPPSNDGLMRPLPATTSSAAAVDFSHLCLEQRVFYRLISGLHASISCHISNAFPLTPDVDPLIDLHAPEHCGLIGPSVEEFQHRVGSHKERITNLYFAFVFMLRAVNKASETLRSYNYSTGPQHASETSELSTLVQETLSSPLVSQCSSAASFDESTLFSSPTHGPYLKSQLRAAMRNISRIMDCVACEKCKLHGKLQILGLGTALRIMFAEEDWRSRKPLTLERNEVMSLLVTLAKFSHALHITRDMSAKITKQEAQMIEPSILQPQNAGPILAAAMSTAGIASIVLLVALCKRRGPSSEVSRSRRNSLQGGGANAATTTATAAAASEQTDQVEGNGYTGTEDAAAAPSDAAQAKKRRTTQQQDGNR